jgi:hypothetical protein
LIYLDTSVALAQLLSEERQPPSALWSQDIVSSRLLEYEMFTRINAYGLGESHTEPARQLLSFVSILEMAPPVLERALDPFPLPVRTLDAIHLSSMIFLRERRQEVQIATIDQRMLDVAEAMGFTQWPGLQINLPARS